MVNRGTFVASPEQNMGEKVFAGKTAPARGGSRGIGFAIARKLGLMGAKVAICARDTKKLDDAAGRLRNEAVEVLAVETDVTSTGDIGALASKTEKSLGPIETLENNAGT